MKSWVQILLDASPGQTPMFTWCVGVSLGSSPLEHSLVLGRVTEEEDPNAIKLCCSFDLLRAILYVHKNNASMALAAGNIG